MERSVPFNIILDELNISRSSAHTPMFQALVNYRLAMTKEVKPFDTGTLTITDGEEGRNLYDITFSFLESQTGGLGVTLDSSASIYDAHATNTLVNMYHAIPNLFFHLVTAYNILRKEGVPLGKMDYLTPFIGKHVSE